MKGCLKFFLGLVLVFLLVVVGGIIAGLFWAERNLFVDKPIDLPRVELDLAQQGQVTAKLLPIKKFWEGKSIVREIKIKFNEQEVNWLVNEFLKREMKGARAELEIDPEKARIRFSRKLAEEKYLNIIASLDFSINEGNSQLRIEKLQIGDFLFPSTILGQIGVFLEQYLDQHLAALEIKGTVIDKLELEKNKIQLELVRSSSTQ